MPFPDYQERKGSFPFSTIGTKPSSWVETWPKLLVSYSFLISQLNEWNVGHLDALVEKQGCIDLVEESVVLDILGG